MKSGEPCHTPFGDFRLTRYPARRDEPLQAWCAADLLLLEEIHRLGTPGPDILVVNDEQGALCVALEPGELWTDSALRWVQSTKAEKRTAKAKNGVFSTNSRRRRSRTVLSEIAKRSNGQ